MRLFHLLLLLLPLVLVSALTVPSVFSSNMVFQRNQPFVFWGSTSTSGVKVSVTMTINSQSYQTSITSGASASWYTTISNYQDGSATDVTVEIEGDGDTIVLNNVAIGDVYICSGQSNMEFQVSWVNNAEAEIEDSINYPNLRMYTIQKVASLVPLSNVTSRNPNLEWGVSSPATINSSVEWTYFSATCYFFGRDLYKGLGGEVPIGLLASDWGGTYVEAWSSPTALAKCTTHDDEYVSTLHASSHEFQGNVNPNTPSVLWNAMIYPILNMRFSGVVWYQGEANANNPTNYACRFPAMIADWRQQFNLPLPFFYVELAAYAYADGEWPPLRQAQRAALKLPLTGFATAFDLGDPNSPEGPIHPRLKQEVGRRLALAVNSTVYGGDAVATGPVPLAQKADRDQFNINVHLIFDATLEVNTGLQLNATQNCLICCGQIPFEFGFNNGKWIRATSVQQTYKNAHIVVTFTVEDPQDYSTLTGGRLDWDDYSQCAIYNAYDLPTPPMSFAISIPTHHNSNKIDISHH